MNIMSRRLLVTSTAFCFKNSTFGFRSFPFSRSLLSNTSILSSIFCRSASSTSQKMVKNSEFVLNRYESIIKSAEDKRQYRGLELRNGLRVLIISDPTSDKNAASIDVNVGHLMDPWELPGLAHFCEHMLFLGTDKYPSENEYLKFLSTHGGSANAFTSTDHTNYHFDVSPEHLEGALDRFVQFFLTPQFTESATEREVLAVDSENSNNIKNDGWRLLQLERSLSNPKHDFAKFGTGNRTTLLDEAKIKGIEPRKALLKFYEQHYSSNIMSLCILTNSSLDHMETEIVSLMFGTIKDKKLQRITWNEHPYDSERLGFKTEVVPVKDLRNISISFPIPDLTPYYRSNPGHYISHLLGHEGPGSLLSELKRRGWVSSLCAGHRSCARGFSFFTVDVDLSEGELEALWDSSQLCTLCLEGLQHVEELIQMIFHAIGVIKRAEPQQWVHEELSQLNQLNFRFKDKERPLSYTTHLSNQLQHFPINDILFAPYRMDEFRPDLIENLLAKLVPDNMNYCVVSRHFEKNDDSNSERWYGTEYRRTALSQDFLTKCETALNTELEQLRMPEKNEYIATEFSLKQRENEHSTTPELLLDDQYTRVWFKQDQEYLLPKAVAYLNLTCPLVSAGPLHFCLNAMFVYCLQDALAEETYNAEMAGLHHSISNSQYGLIMQVWGYDEKQHLFVKHLCERMANFQPNEHRFKVLKENFTRSLKDFVHDQPVSQVSFYTTLLLNENVWSKEQLLKVVDDLTLDRLKSFIPDLLSAVHIEALIFGNSTSKEALSVVSNALSSLRSVRPIRPLFPAEMKHDREHRLDANSYCVYERMNRTHSNSAIEVLLQTGVQDTRSNMLLELLTQLMSEPAFNTLRTKEQLGYIVFSGPRRANGTQGLRIIVQGEKDPKFVETRIESFVESQRKDIMSMSDVEFNENLEALAAKRLVEPKKLTSRAARYWGEICSRMYHFDRDSEEVAELRKISKKDVLEYFDRILALNAPQRRKLTVIVCSELLSKEKFEGDESINMPTPKLVSNVCHFKDELGLYPLPKSHLDMPPVGAVNDHDADKLMT